MIKYLLILLIPAVLLGQDDFIYIGSEEENSSYSNYANQMGWFVVTVGDNDVVVDSFNIRCYASDDDVNVKLGLYDDDSGFPGSPIDSTWIGDPPVGIGNVSWVRLGAIEGVTLIANTDYWLALQANDWVSHSFYVGRNLNGDVGDERHKNNAEPFVEWPDPADDALSSIVVPDFYLTVSENVVILRPDSDETTTDWDKYFSSTYFYENVELLDTKELYYIQRYEAFSAGYENAIISFGTTAPTIDGTIDSVKAIASVNRGGSNANIDSARVRFYDGADISYGNLWNNDSLLDDVYTVYYQLIDCPDGTWGQTDIDDLEIGFKASAPDKWSGFVSNMLHARVYWSPVTGSGKVIEIIQ